MHAARLFRPIRAANRQFSRSLSAATATTTTRTNEAVIPLSNVEAQWEKLTADEQLTVHQQLEELQKRDWRTLSLDEKKAGGCIWLFLDSHAFNIRSGLLWLTLCRCMQLTTLPLDLTDPVPIFILPVVSQNSYWPLRSVSLPEVFFTSPVEPLVGSGITRPVFLPTVLIATLAGSPPKTMTKEWQEASNERARELNLDPITGKCTHRSIAPLGSLDLAQLPSLGVPSEGYSGKGFVQSK